MSANPLDDERPGRLSNLGRHATPLEPGAFEALQARRERKRRPVAGWLIAACLLMCVGYTGYEFLHPAVESQLALEPGSAHKDQAAEAYQATADADLNTSSLRQKHHDDVVAKAPSHHYRFRVIPGSNAPTEMAEPHTQGNAVSRRISKSGSRTVYSRNTASSGHAGRIDAIGLAIPSSSRAHASAPSIEAPAPVTEEGTMSFSALVSEKGVEEAQPATKVDNPVVYLPLGEETIVTPTTATPTRKMPKGRRWHAELGLNGSLVSQNIRYQSHQDGLAASGKLANLLGAGGHAGFSYALGSNWGIRARADVFTVKQQVDAIALPDQHQDPILSYGAGGSIVGQPVAEQAPQKHSRNTTVTSGTVSLYSQPQWLPGAELSAGVGHALSPMMEVKPLVPMIGARYAFTPHWAAEANGQWLTLKANSLPNLATSKGTWLAGHLGVVYVW